MLPVSAETQELFCGLPLLRIFPELFFDKLRKRFISNTRYANSFVSISVTYTDKSMPVFNVIRVCKYTHNLFPF
jgi:hypothetical protein